MKCYLSALIISSDNNNQYCVYEMSTNIRDTIANFSFKFPSTFQFHVSSSKKKPITMTQFKLLLFFVSLNYTRKHLNIQRI